MSTKQKGFFKKLLSSVLSAACLLSGTAVMSTAVMTSSITADAATTEAPAFSWDNATVYFLLTDRFCNGDTSNDHSYGRGLDQNGQAVNFDTLGAFQGGDFAGITKKINEGYFDDLGVNAIWLSAPYEQIHGYCVGGDGDSFAHYSYHGYYVLDYTESDKNFGTKEEFKTLVDTAHEHGIRIVMDIVMNHAGYQTLKDMSEFGFGPLKSGWESYYYAHQNVNNGDYHGFIDYDAGSAATDWAKWWGASWIRCGLAGYTKGSGDVEGCLADLPDFKTGDTSPTGLPQVLLTKWGKEGTLSAKQAKYGNDTVTGYISTWLAEWVSEFGVDGFRCDTAKHVEISAWKTLKDKCVAALNQWRQNNPTAPGANWTDSFWMTGEHFGHSLGKDNYWTSGAFDSMINFEFAPAAGRSNIPSAGAVNGRYTEYAKALNTDPSYNVLTYLASHDTVLIPGDRIFAGSFLLMCPGGIQIYYGDETSRPYDENPKAMKDLGAGHQTRKFMNWDSMDKATLAHWQKVGQFRNNHLAVGAGAHTTISDYDSTTGLTFARTYQKGDIDDKVIVTLFATPNTDITIDTTGIFSEGTEITNFYDGTTCKVSGNKVTFNSGANGTILCQEPQGKKGKVNVKHINQDSGETIKTEVVSGLLGESYTIQPLATPGFTVAKTEGSKTGTFSETDANVTFYYTFDVNNYAYVTVKFVDAATGAEIADSVKESAKIGGSYTAAPVDIKDYEFDASKTGSLSVTVQKGTNTITLKYNYVEPTNLKVHYYNANGWAEVNIYAYDESGSSVKKFTGDWPGTKMTDEGNGWFFIDIPETESAQVIFNYNGDANKEPAGQNAPGYEVSGEVWMKDGKQQTASKVNVMYVSTDGKTLATATLKGLSGETYKTEEKTFTNYTLTEKPANATGTFGTSATTVTYTYKPVQVVAELKNTTTISATTITLGSSVTVKCSSTGGEGTKQYYVGLKKSTDSSFTDIQAYSTNTSCTVKPGSTGTFTVRVTAKDSKGTLARKEFTLTVNPAPAALSNTSKISATTITLGNSATVTCSSTGGTGTKLYYIGLKKSTESSFTDLQAYSTNTSFAVKPTSTGTFTVRVTVKDGKETLSRKEFTLTVNAALKNTSKISATTITLGNSATVTCSSTGGTGTKLYYIGLKQSTASSFTDLQAYSTNTSLAVKPTAAGVYTVRVTVKDSTGTLSRSEFTLTVNNPALNNTSTVNTTSVTAGSSVKVTCSSTGGTGTKYYSVWYKKSSDSDWTMVQDYGTATSANVTFKTAGQYTIRIKAKDSANSVKDKDYTITVTQPLTNTTKVSATTISKGNSVKVTCSSTGGSGTKQYYVGLRKSTESSFTDIQAYSTNTSCTVKPSTTGTYVLRVTVKDATGKLSRKEFDLTVKAALVNTSKVSKTTISKGNSVKVTCASTGGVGTKTYAVWYRKSTNSTWQTAQSYKTNTSVTVKPAYTGTYYIHVKVKDANGTIKLKSFTLKVNAALANTSKLSATSINYGSSVKVTCASTGGVGTKKYAVWYKKSTQTSWTQVKTFGTSTTATVKPKSTGTYTVSVKVKDANGTIVAKRMTLKVKAAPLTNTTTLSSMAILKGNSFTVNCSATGGTGTKKYAVYYKRTDSSSWTTKQNFTTNTSVTIKPVSATTYDVCIKVKDGNGTISKMYKTVAVNTKSASFANTSTVSATSVSAGTKVTIYGSSNYANDMAMYKYEYRSESAGSYTTIKDYTTSTTASFTPSSAGRYFVRVIAYDMTPNTKVKCFVVTAK